MASGDQDRRGFDGLIRVSLAIIPVGLLCLIFYSWKIGLVVFMFGCMSFIALEVISAPPVNSPNSFSIWIKRVRGRKPVLLCLGDSLTHGTGSANFTTEIPFKLSETLGMPIPKEDRIFQDPLWVVNAAQNGITTHTILRERLNKALGSHPDFVFIMLGTNDVRGVYRKDWGEKAKSIWSLPEAPSMQSFERNLKGILDFVYQASPMCQVGVATLPPMGENLDHEANRVIRQANEVIERLVAEASGKVSLVPVYAQLEAKLEKKEGRGKSLSVDYWLPVITLMYPLYMFLPVFFNWNNLSSFVGNTVLSDGLHLNERGRDEVVQVIVDWLVKANVAKAIAVKS